MRKNYLKLTCSLLMFIYMTIHIFNCLHIKQKKNMFMYTPYRAFSTIFPTKMPVLRLLVNYCNITCIFRTLTGMPCSFENLLHVDSLFLILCILPALAAQQHPCSNCCNSRTSHIYVQINVTVVTYHVGVLITVNSVLKYWTRNHVPLCTSWR